MSGVDITGFTGKTIEEINAEISADQLSTVDAGMNQGSSTALGQINGIVAKKAAELWEVEQVAYNAMNRDAAEGVLLDNIGALTGTPRLPAVKSVVTETVNLNASFSQGPGVMIVAVAGQPNVKFQNRDPVTSTTAGNYSAVFEALEYGPVVANAGTLTVITPVSGWNSATNATDAQVGRDREQDPPYRIRQRDELAATGSGTVDGMRADMLKVPGILQAFVFENSTNATDFEGRPPHSVEVVIFDGLSPTVSNVVIAQAIWNSKPSGAATYGSANATVTDTSGTVHTVSFSRATVKPVYLDFINVAIDPVTFPVDGTQQIKDAAAAAGREVLKLGVDVSAAYFKAVPFRVTGVVDVLTLELGFSASPSATVSLVVSPREIALVDTSNITVTYLP